MEDNRLLNEESEETLLKNVIMCVWDCVTLLTPIIAFVAFLNSYEDKYMWLLIIGMCANPISIKIVLKWFDKLSIIADLIPFVLYSLLAYLMVAIISVVAGGTWGELYVLRDLGKRITYLLKARTKKN